MASDVELGLRLMLGARDLWVTTDPQGARDWFQVSSWRGPARTCPPEVLGAALTGCTDAVVNPAGDDEMAERLYQRSLSEYRRAGDEDGATGVLGRLGHSAWYRRRPGAAGARRGGVGGKPASRQRAQRGAGARPAGRPRSASAAAYVEGLDLLRAEHRHGRSPCGFVWWQARMLLRLGKRQRELGHAGDAELAALVGLRLAVELSDRRRKVQLLDLLSVIAADRGDTDRADGCEAPSKPSWSDGPSRPGR